MRLSLFTLFALLPLVLASPTTTTDVCQTEYCPRSLESRAPTTASTQDLSHLTNGQRLARGIPIKPPRWRANQRSILPRVSPIPSLLTTFRGVIMVTNTANGAVLGYISKNSLGTAQYGYQPLLADALIVTFTLELGATMFNNIRIHTENSDLTGGFPLLALVQGRDDSTPDLGPGSFHYAYVAAMAEPGSGPGSIPVTSPENSYSARTGLTRRSSSDVWSYNAISQELVPSWVNSDGSKPTISTFVQGVALYISGDRSAFDARYPAPTSPIAFNFVPL